MTYIYKKSVGSSFVTRPTIRGSGIALSVETSNAEAHAVCICTPIAGGHLHNQWASTVALFLTDSLELPDSGPSKQSAKSRLLIYVYRHSCTQVQPNRWAMAKATMQNYNIIW
jgi:hypothetical protein